MKKNNLPLFFIKVLQRKKRRLFLHLPPFLNLLLIIYLVLDIQSYKITWILIAALLPLSCFLPNRKELLVKRNKNQENNKKKKSFFRLLSITSFLSGFFILSLCLTLTATIAPTFDGLKDTEKIFGILFFSLLITSKKKLSSFIINKENQDSFMKKIVSKLYHYSHTQFSIQLLPLIILTLGINFLDFSPLKIHGDVTLISYLVILAIFVQKTPDSLAQKPLFIVCILMMLFYFLHSYSPIEYSPYWLIIKGNIHYQLFLKNLSEILSPTVFFFSLLIGLIGPTQNFLEQTLKSRLCLHSFLLGLTIAYYFQYSSILSEEFLRLINILLSTLPIALIVKHDSMTSYLIQTGNLYDKSEKIHSKRWLSQVLVIPLIFSYSLFFFNKPILIFIPFYLFSIMLLLSLTFFTLYLLFKEINETRSPSIKQRLKEKVQEY